MNPTINPTATAAPLVPTKVALTGSRTAAEAAAVLGSFVALTLLSDLTRVINMNTRRIKAYRRRSRVRSRTVQCLLGNAKMVRSSIIAECRSRKRPTKLTG